MSDLFKMFKADKRVNVGVSVSPNIGVEMIMIDVDHKTVVKHAFRPLSYNASTREIEDYTEFKLALRELFAELRITPQEADVYLNLPSVLFGHAFLPTTLDNESIMGALVSKAEEQYLFKKNTPVIAWQEIKQSNSASQRYILYSALQEGVIDTIKTIFVELGANLVAIENSYANLIKALAYTGVVSDFANTPGSWNIVLVSQNSYSVFSLLKYDIIEYHEEPIAIKSFNGDEVYFAIAQSASAALTKYPSEKLLVLSESNDVNAEILAMQIKQPGDVIFLDCNQYSKQPLINIDYNVLPHYAQALTPEAIGVGLLKIKNYDLDLNFLTDVEVVQKELINVMGYEITKEALYLVTVFIGVVIIGLCYLGSMAIDKYNSDLESQKNNLEQNSVMLNTELQRLKADSAKIDIFTIAKNIDKSMVEKVTYYNAIGANIPAKVWLTNFYADSKGAYGIAGGTNSVDDVYLFFRNIKSQIPNSDLILSKLSVDDQNGLIDIETTKNANYSFELSNSKYSSSGAGSATGSATPSPSGDMTVPTIPALPGT